MRDLRQLMASLQSDLLHRCDRQKLLHLQTTILWDRAETYGSNLGENVAKAEQMNARIREQGEGKEKKRRATLTDIRKAAVLRTKSGSKVEAVDREVSDAMKIATAMRTKLEEALGEQTADSAAAEESRKQMQSEKESLEETKRRLTRSKNLEEIEGGIQMWYAKSSFGLAKSFKLLRHAAARSKAIDRVTSRFERATCRKWEKLTLARWKLYHERHHGFTKRKGGITALLRNKALLVRIVEGWREFSRKSARAFDLGCRNLLRRIVGRWRLQAQGFHEARHERLAAEAAMSTLTAKKCVQRASGACASVPPFPFFAHPICARSGAS
jgi:hypothetical protein